MLSSSPEVSSSPLGSATSRLTMRWPVLMVARVCHRACAAGWQKPWITTGQNTLQPVNAATGREYRGVSVLMLWAVVEITGYRDGS